MGAQPEATDTLLGDVEIDHYWMRAETAEPPVRSPAPLYDLPPFEPERLRAERGAANSGTLSGEFVFEGAKIRVTPDGQMAAVDALKALGLKDPKSAWKALKANYPELVADSATYSFGGRGRPPEVLGERGVYKLAMVAGGPKAAQFRDWAATQLQRIRTAAPTIF